MKTKQRKSLTRFDGTSAHQCKKGERMICVHVRFWTDEIADLPDCIIPKHAWDSGVVFVAANSAHGINYENSNGRHFHALHELSTAIANALIDEGVTLHPHRKTQKLFRS